MRIGWRFLDGERGKRKEPFTRPPRMSYVAAFLRFNVAASFMKRKFSNNHEDQNSINQIAAGTHVRQGRGQALGHFSHFSSPP